MSETPEEVEPPALGPLWPGNWWYDQATETIIMEGTIPPDDPMSMLPRCRFRAVIPVSEFVELPL